MSPGGGGPAAVLVGAPGAGKSTIGRLLADRLGVGFRDTDADVAATAGKPISEIFVLDGEAEFRRLESAAVAAALATHTGVLALGGGAVLDAQTRQRLAGHVVIFLDVALADAVRRVGLNRDRPLLLDSPRATLMRLMDQRRPFYEEVAVATVPADGSAEDVADAVHRAVLAAATPARPGAQR